MISLQKLLGKDDRFFDLLEAAAREAQHSVQSLNKCLAAPDQTPRMDEFIEARRSEKKIAAEISQALVETFVTQLEREDIEVLADVLYKIPKTVEKIAERIQMAPEHLSGVDFSPQLALIDKASESLRQMVSELRKGMNVARVKAHNEQLQAAEGDMDDTLNELVRGLYHATENPGRVLFLKDVYELLERVTDRCRDAGNIIATIVLKGT